MQNKKWILGVIAAAMVCLLTAAMWPVETGATSDDGIEQTGETTPDEENVNLNESESESGQVVGEIEIPIENTEESAEADADPDKLLAEETTADPEAKSDYLRVLYAGKAINLREKATTKSKVLAVTSKGDQVELLEEPNKNDWCKVRYQDEEGYLKYYHLSDNLEDVLSSTKSAKNENKETKAEADEETKVEAEGETKGDGESQNGDGTENDNVSKDDEESASGEEVEEDWEYLGNYYITGYRMFSAEENGGRSDGVTASGVVGTPGHTVAMKGIPFGTTIYVDGLGYYVVEDRGVGEGCVDIACNTTKETYELTGYRDVYIVK